MVETSRMHRPDLFAQRVSSSHLRERRTEDKGREGETCREGAPRRSGRAPRRRARELLALGAPWPSFSPGAARTGEPRWAAQRPEVTCSHPWIKTPTTNPEADRPHQAPQWWTGPHHSPCPVPLRDTADPGTTVPRCLMHLSGAGYLPSSPLPTAEGPGGPGRAQGITGVAGSQSAWSPPGAAGDGALRVLPPVPQRATWA